MSYFTRLLPHVSSCKMEMLCFRLPGHGDTTLKHMNSLRSRQHFCDITIVASNNQTFRGHKVVLAACSPFLRDQFLLNPSPKLQVSGCQHVQCQHVQCQCCHCVSVLSKDKASFLCYLFHVLSRCRCCTAPQWCVICFSLATLVCCSLAPRRLWTTSLLPATYRWSILWSAAVEHWRSICS